MTLLKYRLHEMGCSPIADFTSKESDQRAILDRTWHDDIGLGFCRIDDNAGPVRLRALARPHQSADLYFFHQRRFGGVKKLSFSLLSILPMKFTILGAYLSFCSFLVSVGMLMQLGSIIAVNIKANYFGTCSDLSRISNLRDQVQNGVFMFNGGSYNRTFAISKHALIPGFRSLCEDLASDEIVQSLEEANMKRSERGEAIDRSVRYKEAW